MGVSDAELNRIRKEIIDYGLTFEGAYEDAPFSDTNWKLVRYGGNKKAFLWTYERCGFININVKVDPEKAPFWRSIYDSVIPGYHQNKEHWNTVILDGSVPEADVKLMIAESYDLISDSPTKRIYEAVRKIPKGKVATYKTIAALAGNPKMSRAVGNALHKNPDPDTIHCFRVVSSSGKLADAFVFGGADVQERLLAEEGIEVTDGTVDLKKYGWNG
ncbi:MAG: methylated-DNA--[protein]-cysteine S-methyltransferase [Lachnospiraceae bacterium]|nr:methylated-DNA--[protein]-cysteine S-methyltransferase [Lachnospiraceae bacterium]